ncbi:MAG: response regulator [Maricaulis sp.]|nr:response regulator [Maricaulis sp.]
MDDDAEDVEMIVDTLASNQSVNSIKSADGGRRAFQLLNSGAFRPDIIFLDLNMPQENGFQVLERVRSMSGFETVPVIILTTSARIEDVRQSLRGTATSFIVKPDNSEKLKSKTSEIIRCVMDGSYIEKQF